MTVVALTPSQVEALMEANAAALGLPIADAHRPGVLTYLALAAGMADLVMGLPLTPHDDPATVFLPVEVVS